MKITLRTVLLWGAGLLAIVAFFLTFGAGVIKNGDVSVVERVGLIFGDQKVITTTSLLGRQESAVEADYAVRSLLSQIGAFMILGGGILAALLGFSKSKNLKAGAVFFALVIAVGAVFVLLVKLGYQESIIAELTKNVTNQNVIDITRNSVESFFKDYENNTLTIVSTILGLLAAALIALAGFVKVKKGK